MNIEEDDAGRLAAFRARFGRSWDSNAPNVEPSSSTASKEDAAAASVAKKAEEEAAKARAQEEQDEEDNLLDLISSFGQDEPQGSGKKKN